jgi:hypothetical protein
MSATDSRIERARHVRVSQWGGSSLSRKVWRRASVAEKIIDGDGFVPCFAGERFGRCAEEPGHVGWGLWL